MYLLRRLRLKRKDVKLIPNFVCKLREAHFDKVFKWFLEIDLVQVVLRYPNEAWNEVFFTLW